MQILRKAARKSVEFVQTKQGQMVALGTSALVPGFAQAALPAEATTAFGNVSTAVTDILAVVWPIVGAVTAGFILIRLFKKGANAAV